MYLYAVLALTPCLYLSSNSIALRTPGELCIAKYFATARALQGIGKLCKAQKAKSKAEEDSPPRLKPCNATPYALAKAKYFAMQSEGWGSPKAQAEARQARPRGAIPSLHSPFSRSNLAYAPPLCPSPPAKPGHS